MSDEDQQKKKRKDRNTGAVKSMAPDKVEDPDQPGLQTEDQIAEELEDSGMMEKLMAGEVQEFEGDPERFEELRAQLKEGSGDMETATAALEELAKLNPADISGESEPVSWEDLAQKTGLSPDDVVWTTKADGEEKTVTLSELEQGFQKGTNYERKTAELSQERREAQQLRDQHAQALEAIASTIGEKLPPEVQELVAHQYQAIGDQRQQEIQQARAQIVPHEQERLEEALGWEGEEADKGRQRLREYAREQGFEDSTLNSILDHRAFVALEKARRWDEARNAVEEGRVKRKNRNLQPGTSGSRKSGKSVSDARKRLKKTGSLNDAQAALEGILS